MGKAKRELMSSAPWRGEEESTEEFRDAKLKVTKQPGAEPVMHVPQKKKDKSKRHDHENDYSLVKIDPQLRYSFQRNYQTRDAVEVGRNSGQIICLPLQQSCEDRRKYLFWDACHPTELEVANNLMRAWTVLSSNFTVGKIQWLANATM